MAIPSPEGLDAVIHERARLAIMSALVAARRMTFNDLKQSIGLTDGNLSAHSRVLEESGYIRVEKGFSGRKPLTTLALTAKGEAAFRRYVDCLEAIVKQGKK